MRQGEVRARDDAGLRTAAGSAARDPRTNDCFCAARDIGDLTLETGLSLPNGERGDPLADVVMQVTGGFAPRSSSRAEMSRPARSRAS